MEEIKPQWELELWENENGFCPVQEFLDDLEKRKSTEYERMIKKLNQFKKYPLAVLKQTQNLGKVKNEEFWELRISINIEIRLLGVLDENEKLKIFHVVHGFHKKDQKIRKSDLEITRERIKEII